MNNLQKYRLIKSAQTIKAPTENKYGEIKPEDIPGLLGHGGAALGVPIPAIIGAIYGAAKKSKREKEDPRYKTTIQDRLLNSLGYGLGGGVLGGVLGGGLGYYSGLKLKDAYPKMQNELQAVIDESIKDTNAKVINNARK